MGRGIITQNIGAGKYRITRIYATDYAKKLAAVTKQIKTIEKRIADLETQKAAAQDDITKLTEELNDLLYSGAEKESDAAKIKTLCASIAEKTALYERQWAALIACEKLKLTGVLETQATVTTLKATAGTEIDAWCATYLTDLTGAIETIEVDDQSNSILIAPAGHATLPGILKQTPFFSPAEVYYNAAMLPGIQKWRPRYKTGTILAINKIENTCTVKLIETSLSGLNTLVQPTLTGVPVEYLGCNSSAFNVGDAVIVEFKERARATPIVIGFQHDPKPCLPLLLVRIHAEGYDDYSIVWNIGANAYHVIPAVTFPCESTVIAAWAAARLDAGKDLFMTQVGGFAIEDWGNYDSDCQIVTPSNSACQKNTQVACEFPGPDGAGGLINTRQVNRIGSEATYGMLRIEEMLLIYDVIPQARRAAAVPQNIQSTRNTYGAYDVPFPTQKVTALNNSGYVGSVGTSFISGPGAPFFWHYRNYSGYKRYDESVTKHYSVTSPLGVMLTEERRSIWTQYPGGDVSYDLKTFDEAQGIIGGQYSTTALTQFYLMQYLEKVATKTRTGAAAASYNDRIVTVHAQIYAGAGLTISPYNNFGRDTELETAILALVAAWYVGNSISLKELKPITITWKIIS